jgi:3-hydroxy-3-methylglutaryl CoA synthase/uncharacterized OB-fold protein
LKRSAIAEALGSGGRAKGTRAVASYDEDSTSMGVEAARAALRSAPDGTTPASIVFATTSPPYLDKTNATAIHAALDLPRSTAAYDAVGSVRSTAGALRAGFGSGEPTLVVAADVRTGLPGGTEEANSGDGAAAVLFGTGSDVVAELVGTGSASAEFLDRWRLPGDLASRQWEERFGEVIYIPLAEAAFTDALKEAGETAGAIDHVAVAGLHGRAARKIAGSLGARPEAAVEDLTAVIGNTGAAHPAVLLASILDTAKPGALIALVVVSDGADVFLLRTTDAIAERRAASSVAAQVAQGNDSITYPTFLTWRGVLRREPPRRPDPAGPAAPPSARRVAWKFGFTASKCEACGTRHLPPARVCVKCSAVDQMASERLADVAATVATYTIDRLAYSLNPPVVAAVIDFDGGGRMNCELTDVDPASVRIGDRVEMTFRRPFTGEGIHNYFWKARPIRNSGQG